MNLRIADTFNPDDGESFQDVDVGTIMIAGALPGIAAPATGADVPAIGIFEGPTHTGDTSNGSVTVDGLTQVKIGAGAFFVGGDYRFTHDASGHAIPLAAGKYQVGELRAVISAPTPGALHECIVKPLRVAQA